MIQGFSGGLLNRELIYQTDLPSFQRDFASLKTLDHGTGPAITFTRASGATFFDADGVLQTAANDAPRFDHSATGSSLGLLIEEARTNSIRNSQAGGAVAGAPGTLPTNWAASTATGINREVVATGTLNGLAYIDLKFSGTNTSGGASSIQVLFESTTQIVASTGQNWSASAYVALIAGGFSNITNERLVLTERSDAGAALSSHSVAITSATATLQRYSVSAALAEATAARVTSSIIGSVADGATIDITLRIAAPQLEQGSFATSYIPTTTAAATRAVDSAVVTPISSFYNQVESTIFSELSSTSVAFDSTILAINNGTQNEQLDQRLAITAVTARARVGGVNVGSIAGVSPVIAPVAGTVYKFVAGYKQDDFAASMDGATVVTDTSGNMPTGLSQMVIGSRGGSAFLNGHIRKIAYWPKRLTNTLLEQLTT